ncbi:MAG: putative molybdenum carrier protein [Verrucomicrobiae bacterium]
MKSHNGGKLAVPPGLEKLISGGQTGADRAALDVAIRHGFPHGGWCPKGRKAEDGPIDGRYNLFETPSANYLQRTEWNVRDTDGTVVFTLAKEVTGGSLRTIEFAQKHKKPCLHISARGSGYMGAALPLQEFVAEHGIRRLNVAGPRASKEPGVWQFAYQTIDDAFFWSETHGPMIGGPGEG